MTVSGDATCPSGRPRSASRKRRTIAASNRGKSCDAGAQEDLVGRMDQRYRDQDAMSWASESKTAARVSRGSEAATPLMRGGRGSGAHA